MRAALSHRLEAAYSDLAGRRVLVTGATGFIGSRLIDRLGHAGAQVHAVSRTTQPEDGRGIRWRRTDLEDLEAVAGLFASIEPEVVFHLGGNVTGRPSPELVVPTLMANLVGTVSVLEAGRRVGCDRVLVPVSSTEPELGPDEAPPRSPYAASKWASWGYTRMFHSLWDVPAVLLRVTMVYGPGQSDPRKLIPSVVASLLEGATPRLTSGRDRYDWVYIDDVADAMLLAAAAPNVVGETVEIGSGDLVSVRELVERLGAIVDPGVEPRFGEMPDRPSPPARVADAAKTQRVLGWRAATGLDKGLEQTVAWFRSRASVAVGA
jgi:UDP-glucose 4-epimerase